MKKVLSVLLAGAMTASMAVTAFAAGATTGVIYNSDGEKNGDVYDSTIDWKVTSGEINLSQDINIDGVVPGAKLYIPLSDAMSATHGDLPTGTPIYYTKTATEMAAIYTADSTKVADYVTTKVCDALSYAAAAPTAAGDFEVLGDYFTLSSLTDTDNFKIDIDKDEGSKYISKIEVVDDKKLGSLDRTAYLVITLADSTTTSDLKATGTITFEAKKSAASAKVTDQVWSDDAEFPIDYSIWMNNDKASNDDNVGTGDRVYFDPDDNEDNTLVWGDDRAALFFEANDDASKFYARLQTKSDSEIYSTYGDPVNADLWFFDFVGNPTVPATSRATLTLGIPWDEDDDYTPNAEDCFIYEKDADGNLTDVTSKFTYSEDNDGTTEIPGWTIKTRTLGTFVISDTELDTEVIDDVDEEEVEDTSSAVVDGGKEIPNTGSSDMVGVAVVAAVVSLAAAGAVAFKKASK